MTPLISNPEILIHDKPFSNLDLYSQTCLKNKLMQLHKEGTSIIISSHDFKHVTEVCNRILLLDEGNIVQDKNTNVDTLVELEGYFKV